MTVTIEIADVPEALVARLEERANKLGLSISDYLLRELTERIANQDALDRLIREQLDKVHLRDPVLLSDSPAALIRQARDAG